MPQQKNKIDVLVIIMQSQKQNLKYIKLKLQQNTELQQLSDYLKNKNKISFKNIIFTTKPAQKGQFTMQKTIKQLSTQCKVKQGAYVILCYESQVQNNVEESIKEFQSLKSSQASNKSSPYKESTFSNTNEDKKKKQEDKCIVF